MAARKVARKVSEVKKPASKKSAPKKPVHKSVEVKLQVTIWVDSGPGDERSYEEFSNDLKASLTEVGGSVGAKHVLITSGYYLVDGRVCLPGDFDQETRGFKPGSHPPLWAGGPNEDDILRRIEAEKELPEIARNPPHLRTVKETRQAHSMEEKEEKPQQKTRTPAEAIRDLHENTEWGRNKKAEMEESSRREKEEQEAADEDEDFIEWEDDEDEAEEEEETTEEDESDEEDDEADDFEWEDDDAFDEDVADAAIEEETSSALSRLKNGSSGKKPVTRRAIKRRK